MASEMANVDKDRRRAIGLLGTVGVAVASVPVRAGATLTEDEDAGASRETADVVEYDPTENADGRDDPGSSERSFRTVHRHGAPSRDVEHDAEETSGTSQNVFDPEALH